MLRNQDQHDDNKLPIAPAGTARKILRHKNAAHNATNCNDNRAGKIHVNRKLRAVATAVACMLAPFSTHADQAAVQASLALSPTSTGAVPVHPVRVSRQKLRRWYRAGQPLPPAAREPGHLAYAEQVFCRRAARGSLDALVQLGWVHVYMTAQPRSINKAASLFQRAAAHGHPVARTLASRFPGHSASDALPPCLERELALTRQSGGRTTRDRNELSTAGISRSAKKHRNRVARAVASLSRRYKLDPRLVLAIIQLESGFRTHVVSPQNAMGLMQLTPDTASRFGVDDPKNWRQNLRGGMAYLRWLLAYFEGDVILVAAAYNSGEGNVNKYGGVPPFKETMDYVAKVRAIYHRDFHPFNPRVSAASPMLARQNNPTRRQTVAGGSVQTVVRTSGS